MDRMQTSFDTADESDVVFYSYQKRSSTSTEFLTFITVSLFKIFSGSTKNSRAWQAQLIQKPTNFSKFMDYILYMESLNQTCWRKNLPSVGQTICKRKAVTSKAVCHWGKLLLGAMTFEADWKKKCINLIIIWSNQILSRVV